MIITTTPSVEGKIIKRYISIVSGESDKKVGGITGGAQGVSGALSQMTDQATGFDADAIVGVQFVGPSAHLYSTIHIYGTAVQFK